MILYEVGHEKKGTLSLKVRDTGIGIKNENQQKLFKPFSQESKEI